MNCLQFNKTKQGFETQKTFKEWNQELECSPSYLQTASCMDDNNRHI